MTLISREMLIEHCRTTYDYKLDEKGDNVKRADNSENQSNVNMNDFPHEFPTQKHL